MALRDLIVVPAVLACASVTGAIAHPVPKTASPAPNAVLSASPIEIRIGFNEKFVVAFSGLDLRDASNRAVALGPSTVNPSDEKEIFAQIKAPLVPGAYTVMWHAVGDDTHRVKGHYTFQVKP